MKNKKIKAVIFDLDGTLIDTEKYYMKAWPEAMQHFGYEFSYEDALSMRSLGRPYAPEHLKALSKDPNFDYAKVRAFRKERMEFYLDTYGITLKPFAKEILEKLHEHNLLVALGTANDYARTKRYLERIGLFDFFDKICCADMVSHGKPAPDLYAFAAKELGLSPDECFAIEDSPNGVLSAARAGLATVMIPDLTQPDDELCKLLYAKYNSLEEFYLEEINHASPLLKE